MMPIETEIIEVIASDLTHVSEHEIKGVNASSVKVLPNKVINKADEVKQRMVNIVTDPNLGAVAIINKRVDETKNAIIRLNQKLLNDIATAVGISGETAKEYVDRGLEVVTSALVTYVDNSFNLAGLPYVTNEDIRDGRVFVDSNGMRKQLMLSNLPSGITVIPKGESIPNDLFDGTIMLEEI